LQQDVGGVYSKSRRSRGNTCATRFYLSAGELLESNRRGRLGSWLATCSEKSAREIQRRPPALRVTFHFFMKALLYAAAAALIAASNAGANLIPLSGTASVSVAGHASSGSINGGGGDSYALSQSATTPFASFNGNVSGVATWTIPPPEPGEIFMAPRTFSASSQATQTVTVSAGALTVAGSVSAQHGANVGPPYAFAAESAHSLFDFVFRVEETSAYSLTLDVSGQHGHGLLSLVGEPTFSLTALGGGGFSLGMADVTKTGPAAWAYNGQGLFAPGDYRLIYNLGASASADPLGDFDAKTFSLGLQVASVPDTAGTHILLLISLAAVAGLRRRSRLSL
jgi:hypothetical protein